MPVGRGLVPRRGASRPAWRPGGAQGPALRLTGGQAKDPLHETLAAVELAAAVGALGEAEAATVQALALRVKRMLRALMR